MKERYRKSMETRLRNHGADAYSKMGKKAKGKPKRTWLTSEKARELANRRWKKTKENTDGRN